MGKRNKEQSVGRRRPMIQLGSARKGVGVVSKNVTEQPTVLSNSSADDQLAGFLAEINSLDSNSATDNSTYENNISTQQPVSTESNTDAPQGELLYDPNNFDPSTQGHLLPSPWEACYDHNTGYYYYWNKTTNEVQWYPPAVTIPPPPPPPSVGTDILLNDIKPESPATNLNIASDENVPNEVTNESKASIVDENTLNENIKTEKNKDKELMNRIKERIQKKKEEKLKKEQNVNENNEVLENQQKQKEDKLREKLIRKKQEREQALSKEKEDTNLDESNHDLSTDKVNDTSKEENFSVDMFAEENVQNNVVNEMDVDSIENVKESVEEFQPTVKTEVEISESNNTAESNPPSAKEAKGGWRIVDSVYDDESGDSEGEGGKVTTKDENSESNSIEPNIETESKQNGTESKQNGVNNNTMEDYADMLLEDGITDKDENEKPPLPKEDPPAPLPPMDGPPLPPPPPPEDEPAPPSTIPPLSELEQEVERRKEITRLSSELSEKLNFLGISSKSLKSFEVYLVELETRKTDWQAGALDTKYFLETLNKLSELIGKNEQTAAPAGWMCHWNNEYKMYYYHNSVTGESQWEYPATPSMADYTSSYHALFQQSMMASYATMATANPSIVSPAHGFSREKTSTSQSKKRSATDLTKLNSETSADPYRAAKRKKEKAADATEETSQLSGTDSGTSSPITKVIASAPLIRTRESSPAVTATPPLPIEEYAETPSPLPPSQDNQTPTVKTKLKKKKKDSSVNLASKKLKQVSSLVQKWQTVKQQAEEEENAAIESSDEETYEEASQRRIEEWKKEVEMSGNKESNPNFTEIKGDWRARLKRKT